MIRWPPGIDPRRFFERHWQKTPLLMPSALPTVADALMAPEELAGLACEPEVESRLVIGDMESGWRVRHGPFEEADFHELPDSRWTLLVQDVEKHLPRLGWVLDEFDFLPRWRIDDLMISYAAPGGSVGPHIDSYDVFLLQADGVRMWEIQEAPGDVDDRPDSDLRVLSRFEPDTRYQVGPGDMLYLPPGVAHFGVSERPSLTCSIGFRAPNAAELLSVAAGLQEEGASLLYSDADLQPSEVAGSEISPRAVERARRWWRLVTDQAEIGIAELLGRLATGGKPWLLPDPADDLIEPGDVIHRLSAGARLERYPGSRFAWTHSDDACLLFADGRSWRLPSEADAFCRAIADGPTIDMVQLEGCDPRMAETLAALLTEGCLAWVDDDRGEAL